MPSSPSPWPSPSRSLALPPSWFAGRSSSSWAASVWVWRLPSVSAARTWRATGWSAISMAPALAGSPSKGDLREMADTPLHLDEASFDAEVGKHKELLMVDFWAEWCAPCRAIAPTLEELATDSQGTVSLAKVNVDDSPALAARYGIRSIPTILFMKEGKVVDQVIGAVPKSQLKKKLDSLA